MADRIPDPGPFSDGPATTCNECGQTLPRIAYSIGLPPGVFAAIPIKVAIECECGNVIVLYWEGDKAAVFLPGMINPSGQKVRQT